MVVTQQNKLPRDVAESPALEILWTRLDTALSNTLCQTHFEQSSWTTVFHLPFNPDSLILWRLLIRCTTFPGRNCNTGKINGYLNALLHRTVIVKKFRNSCENTVAIINFFLNSAFPVLCHLCLSWKVLPRFFTFDYNFTTNSFSIGIPSVKEGMITSTCVPM